MSCQWIIVFDADTWIAIGLFGLMLTLYLLMQLLEWLHAFLAARWSRK